MNLRIGSTEYEPHSFKSIPDNKGSCVHCGLSRHATGKDESGSERLVHDVTGKMTPAPSLDMERAKPLRDWLNERNARCAWQVPATKLNPRAIEGWIVNGCVVVIICAEYGWELYTQPSTNNIEATLIDAERRIGLDPPPTLAKIQTQEPK